MKKIIMPFLLVFTLNIMGQVSFEKGNIIDNQGKKTECLIKNQDWAYNPNEFEYRLTEASPVQSGFIKDISSFQIYDSPQYYKRFTFQVDKNTDKAKENYVNETQFLQVLVEGKAELYEANFEGTNYYFYKLEENNLKPLVHKKYAGEDFKVHEVNDYQKDLYENLKCDGITADNIRKVKYSRQHLIAFFIGYSKCQKAESRNFQANKTKLGFNFKFTAGINSNGNEVSMKLGPKQKSIKFDNQVNPAIGFEMELLLPFGKNKWGIFINPNYQSYKESTKENITLFGGYYGDLKVKYSYIEIPIGIRHYFYLNKDSKLSASLAYCIINQFDKENSVLFDSHVSGLSLDLPSQDYTTSSIKLSFGYTYKNKYDLRLDYSPVKKLSNDMGESNMSGSIALVLGYKLF